MPYWDKQKKRWVGQVKIRNKKYRSFHLSKTLAKKWEVKKREEMELQGDSSRIHTISLLEFATQYLDFSKMKFSQKTFEEKKLAFRLLFNYVDPTILIEQLHKGDVLKHLQRQSEDRSGYAANKDRKNLVAAWNWAVKYIPEFPSYNPFLVDRFPEVRSPRYIPPIEDFWKVYEKAEFGRDKIMLLSFLHLAARRNEIFNLRCDDVDLVKKQVRLFTRKRRDGSLEFDWLPLTGRLFHELSELLSQNNSEWVFPNPKSGIPYIGRAKWLPRLCVLAGVDKFGIHAIRHLSASILVKHDASLIDIQTILRHKNLTTTERYLHRLESVRSAMKAFD